MIYIFQILIFKPNINHFLSVINRTLCKLIINKIHIYIIYIYIYVSLSIENSILSNLSNQIYQIKFSQTNFQMFFFNKKEMTYTDKIYQC